MYATNDRIIYASQKWDMYLKEKDFTKINNCPVWNRITSWDTIQDGHIITCGSDTIFDYLLPAQRDGFVGLQKYAVKANKDFYTFVAIVKKYYPKDEIRTGAYYNPVILDKLCEKYWPGENLIKYSVAVDIVYRPEFLPEIKWNMGTVRYYDKKECEAAKEKRLAHNHKMRAVSLELLQERSRKNKEKHNARKREKRRLEREAMGMVRPTIDKKTKQLPTLPGGFEKLADLSKRYGLAPSTANKAALEGRMKSKKIDGKYYCKLENFLAYFNNLRQTVPEGYIAYTAARMLYGIPSIRLTRIVARGNIPNVVVSNRHYVDAEMLKARIDYENSVPPEAWSNQHKRGVGKLEGYYSVNEAMRMVNKSRCVLHKHINKGNFKSVKKNGMIYVEAHSLLNFYGLNQGSLFEEGAN